MLNGRGQAPPDDLQPRSERVQRSRRFSGRQAREDSLLMKYPELSGGECRSCDRAITISALGAVTCGVGA
jgi:hypothetical protein